MGKLMMRKSTVQVINSMVVARKTTLCKAFTRELSKFDRVKKCGRACAVNPQFLPKEI
jgi:hypothetical protein